MIVVMGLPGAGKSTVLKGLKTDYKIINYGDLMFEIAKARFGLTDRDHIRKLDTIQQQEIQRLVAERLSKETGKVILDTHCSVSTPNGYLPGLPFSLLSMLKVDKLVLLTADIHEVIARRRKDPSRPLRDKEDEWKLEEHDEMNRAFLAAYASFTGAPAAIIYNRDGKLEEAVARLQDLLK